jgi:hypothetical protein
MADKPMGVMPLCIIAIFLGVMGVLGGMAGAVTLLINPKAAAPTDKDGKVSELNAEFQRRMQKMTEETRPLSLMVVPVVIATSALLAVAGILGFNLKGLGLLKGAFAVNLLADLAAAVVGFIAQYKSMAIMKWYMSQLPGGNDPAVAQGVQIGMQFGLYAGMFFGVFWLALKLAYYIVGLVYFNKRAIVDAFSSRPAPEAAG